MAASAPLVKKFNIYNLKRYLKREYSKAREIYENGKIEKGYRNVRSNDKYDILMDDLDNSITFYKKGTDIPHRECGPAIVSSRKAVWIHDGKIHRVNKPAYITLTAVKFYKEDKLHRNKGPAWIENGVIIYAKNGIPYIPLEIIRKMPREELVKMVRTVMNNDYAKHTKHFYKMFNIVKFIQ